MRHATDVPRGQLGACSGCAGDYEDPERTTRDACDEADTDEANVGAREPAPHDRFPVREE